MGKITDWEVECPESLEMVDTMVDNDRLIRDHFGHNNYRALEIGEMVVPNDVYIVWGVVHTAFIWTTITSYVTPYYRSTN